MGSETNLATRVVTFRAAHSRDGLITVERGQCDVCGMDNVPVIAIDSSEEEYGPGRICRACAVAAFEKFDAALRRVA